MDFDTLSEHIREYRTLDDDECLSLPPAAYLSDELHAREVERIFSRSWLCVGREDQIPDPGDYYTFDLLDEPLLVVRGADGEVRVLSRICRHRYMPVCEDGAGNAGKFVCPYHAWSYATDGTLMAAPHMEGSKRFDRDACSLPRYRLESWYGFLFVNLDDDAEPLAPRMRTLEEHIANYRVDQQVQVLPYQEEWAGNWKLAAENSMEYYHHIGLHRTTVGVQMPGSGTYVPAPPADLSFTHERCRIGDAYRGGQDHAMNPAGRLDLFTEEELTTGYLVYVFPAFTMAMRPNGNNWLSFAPNGTERTRVLGGYMVSPEIAAENPDLAEQRRDLVAEVNREDSLATTELARVMRSRKAARGPLSPFEATIAQFYRYLARTLT